MKIFNFNFYNDNAVSLTNKKIKCISISQQSRGKAGNLKMKGKREKENPDSVFYLKKAFY